MSMSKRVSGAPAPAVGHGEDDAEPLNRLTPAAGFSIPMTTDEQVARRDALRERARAELARHKAARAS